MDEHVTDEQLKELVEMDPLIRTAEERLVYLSGDEQMIRLYEAREEALFDRNSLMSDARKEGIAEGIQKGMQKGMQKGKAEGKADLIYSMLQKGLTVSQISDLTGLTVEEVNVIKRK